MVGRTYLLLLFAAFFKFSDAAHSAMSIDFGSQYLKLSLVKPGIPMEMILNKESKRKTPNVIVVRNGEVTFGDSSLLGKYPANSFTNLLDLLGKKVDNPIVSLYRERFPFVKISDDSRNTVQFSIDDETFNIETLVALVLNQARKIAEEFANQTVVDVVITVPAFFNQVERHAMACAAKIAGLNLLQARLLVSIDKVLMNDHTAAGLNYGMFRRKEITEKPQKLLIYDVGHSKVTASILEYVIIEKDGSKDPAFMTIGYGYDRKIGGLEISLRLRDYLVSEFRRQKKTKEDITTNPRAMAKLLAEAERVLSANPEHKAQIETLHEEQDFSARVSREIVENIVDDLQSKFLQPIIDALKMAELKPEQLDQLVLMGAGTRVPCLKVVLQSIFKDKEIGKFLNTDEAIAMGAVYHAAHLSKGFKVLQFGVRDLQILPIQVDFISTKNEAGIPRITHRPVYGYKSMTPSARKLISLTSFTTDFSVNISYGELKHFTDLQRMELGSLNISNIEITGLTDAYIAETAEKGTIFKGVKMHFNLDSSGVFHVEGAELQVERPQKAKSALASIAGKISGLFSSKTDDDTESKDTNKEEEKTVEDPANKTVDIDDSRKTMNNANSSDQKIENKTQAESNGTDAEKEANDHKPKIINVSLKLAERRLDAAMMSDSEIHSAKNRLKAINDKEKAKIELETAHHDLESLVYDLIDKLTAEEFQKFLTENERSSLEVKLRDTKSWLEDEVDSSTKKDDFLSKKNVLDVVLDPINERIKDHQERPLLVAELSSAFNHTEIFLSFAKNMTEAEVFTETEIKTLSDRLNETKTWLVKMTEAQSKLNHNETPVFNVSEGKEKLYLLEREVSYLLNKMKIVKPKVKKADNSSATNDTETSSSNKTIGNDTKVPESKLKSERVDVKVDGQSVESDGDEKKEDEKKSGESSKRDDTEL